MKLTYQGITFNDYKLASPGTGYSIFTDEDGTTFQIRTTTLIRMYEIVKYDLERRDLWDFILEEVEKES